MKLRAMTAVETLEVSTEFEMWMENLRPHFSADEIGLITQAYQVAAKAHTGQTRRSGEPFITHSLNVAKILSTFELDAETLAAGLLHDVPEDTNITVQSLCQIFNPAVAALVDGVTKLTEVEDFDHHHQNPLRTQTRKEFQRAESLRKMILAMGDDVRVVLIKLADRLHNMRTLGAMPDHKRRRIAQETLDIYAPLASRLGIYQIKVELEDKAFRYLHPTQYKEVAHRLSQSQATHTQYITQLADHLKGMLRKANVEADLLWRTKHLYSIFGKMRRKGVDFDHIHDIAALRVIVDNIPECYIALGIVHTNWHPIPGEFDDYIAVPKENGYQSLHTSVMDPQGERFEVQIRTKNMDYQAELGIAAHWRYKDGSKPDHALDRKITAMRQAIYLQKDVITTASEATDAGEFVDGFKADMTEERVYIFTPQGDILNLPQDATPIDFAYYIHTEVGHKCRGAKVNGNLVSLDYKLSNGDKVEILTAKRGGPSRDWLNENLGYIKTSRARSKIRYWFKRQNFEDSVSQGREILDREFKRLNLDGIKIDKLAGVCGYAKTDDFLAAVGFNDISIQQVMRKALEILPDDDGSEETFIPVTQPVSAPPTQTDSVSVMGTGSLLTHLANCCRPVPGDQVIGYITRGKGVTVHRSDCSNVLKIQDRERLIEVDWGTKQEKTFDVEVIIRAFDRPGLIRDISHVIANERVNIHNVDVITRRKNHTAEILLILEINSVDHLIKVMDKIEQLPNIIFVRRRGQIKEI